VIACKVQLLKVYNAMKGIVFVLCELTSNQKKQVLIDLNSGAELVYLDNIILCSDLKELGVSVSSMALDVRDDLEYFFRQVKKNDNSASVINNIPYLDTFTGSLLEPLLVCLKRAGITAQQGGSIFVYCSKYGSNKVPLIGFKTIEVPFGSSLMIGAYIGAAIRQSASDKTIIIFRYRPRDIFCYDFLMRAGLIIIETIFILNFISKLIRLKFKLRSSGIMQKKFCFEGDVFIARTPLQIQYANDLASCFLENNVVLMLIPQGRLGRLGPLLDSISVMPVNMKVVLPSIRNVLANLFKFLIFNKSSLKQGCEYTFDHYGFSFNSNSINEDLKWFLYEGIYSQTLMDSLPKESKRIFNFSLKGRYAIFEKNVADLICVPITTIQTANLDATKSYNFPVSDFYCDSQISYNLGINGFIRTGRLLYEGCPFRLKKLSVIKKIKSITFFTQPYEFDINLILIDILVHWCEKNDALLVIKLHPRDNKARYSNLAKEGQGVLTFSKSNSAKKAIEMTDVCITRTSAIGLEALALGVPSLYCLFSDFDHSVQYGYINIVKLKKYFAKNEFEIKNFLDRPYLLNDQLEKMQSNVFGGKDIMSLSSSLLENDALNVN
jgi:hypothetical protein